MGQPGGKRTACLWGEEAKDVAEYGSVAAASTSQTQRMTRSPKNPQHKCKICWCPGGSGSWSCSERLQWHARSGHKLNIGSSNSGGRSLSRQLCTQGTFSIFFEKHQDTTRRGLLLAAHTKQ
jgi:hypothetical protein